MITAISSDGALPGSGSGMPSGVKVVCQPVINGGFEASAAFCTPGMARSFVSRLSVKLPSFVSSFVSRAWQHNPRADEFARLEAEIERRRFLEALQDERCGTEQDKRQRHLGNDEHLTRTPRRRRIGAAVRAGFQSRLRIRARGLPRRPETEENARAQRQAGGEEQHPSIQPCLLKTEHVGRRKRDEKIASPRGEKNAKQSARDREDETFEQELPDDLPARRSDRHPHREFAAARRTARGEQVRHVRACDQQHEHDRAQQHREAGAVFADLVLEELHDLRADAGVRIRILLLEPRRDRVQLALRGLHRDARLQPAPPDEPRMIAALLPVRVIAPAHQRKPHFRRAR